MNNLTYNVHTVDNEKVWTMAEENRNRKQVQISLSENQLAAIDKAAAENGMNRSEFIRHTFAQTIENFPNDLQAHGAALNKSREL